MFKTQIINDPVHGFITISEPLILKIIDHPVFQRLRKIKQLGLTELVYPGAVHSRFQHALGAMHLMRMALQTLTEKGHHISKDECEGALIAILLHDSGHGPFSHILENVLVPGIRHEKISWLVMKKLNTVFHGKLSIAISIFSNQYPKKFLHQLVSSQLDVDRMDYLARDSFFTGVAEGIISYDRIIKMMNVVNDRLVIEEKGMYSIEKFLIARRLMYWQVYLHKTVHSASEMLTKILKRAKELLSSGNQLPGHPSLIHLLDSTISTRNFMKQEMPLENFLSLDDNDVWSAVKCWQDFPDTILSLLCKNLANRNLFKIELSETPFSKNQLTKLNRLIQKKYAITPSQTSYFVFTDYISNHAYFEKQDNINILMKSGRVLDVSKATGLWNLKALDKEVRKYFLCHIKNLYK
ncbi:MAG: phosphohydrolase [Bacteroidetes bacterium RIFCSPLOWO2_02_FULL_36_8]|nr:MAG: phosphohydrolase [Bacteroidetes bacterium RIFCSPLOWO2_02_FULL_36_8]OFY71045.1 MAG: phosphohydrolase [Bacteroidetes bacterium RIFCSPLOWO2_12_FULL_37_12]